MKAVDKFVIYDDVNFIKKGWINRNQLLVNKKPYLFTVPLENASQNALIKDLKLAATEKWKKKFLKTLEFAYKRAPFFNDIFLIVYDVLNMQTSYLRDWHLEGLNRVARYLGIKISLVESSSNYKNNELNSRTRILDICIKENAKKYLNPIGGINLYSKQYFESKGIHLYFLKSKDIYYKQFDEKFNPWLSIIDVMMFNPVFEISKMLHAYELI